PRFGQKAWTRHHGRPSPRPEPMSRSAFAALPLCLLLALPALAAASGPDAGADASPAPPAVGAAPPATIAEQSGFVRTGRYDEVIALCAGFATRYPDAVRCIDFGTTPEGRPMKALVASRSGALAPEAARAAGLPVLLVQGGIHAGEVDGKDAGFLA